MSIERSVRREPFDRLPRHPRDGVEVAIVVDEDRAAELGRGGDAEIGRRRATMVAFGRECCLDLLRTPPNALDEPSPPLELDHLVEGRIDDDSVSASPVSSSPGG